MEQVCVLSFLGINSYLDIRKGEISLWAAAAYMLLSVPYLIFCRQRLMLLTAGVLPGLLLLCVGKISGGALGMGDGLMVLVAGVYMGIWKTLELITVAALLAAVWAGVLLLARKKGGKSRFPFAPFLLAAYVLPWFVRAVRG